MQIIKRDGSIETFYSDKIVNAITGAMDETELGVDFPLALKIAQEIEQKYIDVLFGHIPTVEIIQDDVEELLMNSDRKDVAKRYIIYREERNQLRNKGWNMTELQRDIYEQKYRYESEIFDEFLERVSGGNQPIKKLIRDKKFLPAGRILAGMGMKEHGKNVTLSNCYVMPKVEDTIESIFDTAKYLARTYSYGGGCGVAISNLRPKGAKVQNSAHTTTGATSFMDLYSMVTGLIGQRGRRGALMLNIDVTHPDIEEFIDIKSTDSEKVRFANISVNMTKEFMNAVKNDEYFDLEFMVQATSERITKRVKAKELFKKLAKNNWNMAEPGILFQDRIDSWHLMSEDKTFSYAGVNPCAEEPLPPFGSCNLASINLSEFVVKDNLGETYFDYNEFSNAVKHGVIYLNEILDLNMDNHPLPQQSQVSRDLKQIGLGIMGLADMFIKLGIRYGSEDSIDLIHIIGNKMVNSALQQSALLAKEHGTFPLYDDVAVLSSPFLLKNATDETMKMIATYGLRNSQILTIAPTGSISTMIGTSGGIEPLFQISYTRKSETLHEGDTYYKVFTPIAREYMEVHGITNEEELPEFFVTSSTLDYKERIRVQSAWQEYIDASISSTVNVPNEFTIEEVEDLYMYAWQKGLKGVTMYRDGCLRGGVLITNDKKIDRVLEIDDLKVKINQLASEELMDNPDICPMCGGNMFHSGGCSECAECGYSPCSI